MAHSSGGHHPYPRSARVNQILREVISDELLRISDTDERLGLLTVTGVETTSDLRQAMVYLDSLSDDARVALEERRSQIQSSVNVQTRLKRTPKLSFMADPAVARGTVQLGVATDSLDADGTPTERRAVPSISHDVMNAAAGAMLGIQQQIPPMVSAVKVGGRRLHQLARQGVEVEREARDVTIYSFALVATDDPSVWSFDIECSVGTYVRVLLSDLTSALGTVGHLSSLRRTRSGDFRVEDALSVEQLSEVVAGGGTALRAPVTFVEKLEHVVLEENVERKIRMGQRVTLVDPLVTDEIAALNGTGQLVAILRRRGETWQPEVVLPEEPLAS